MATLKQIYDAYSNPNAKRFLDFIADAEGVKNGYNTLFGNQRFDNLSAHPNVRKAFKQTDGTTNYTTAAGRYQFLKGTWDGLAKQYGFRDFSPQAQDMGALALIASRGALDDVLKGNYTSAVQKLGKEWASLPSSTYAQGKRSWDFVKQRLGGEVPTSRYLDSNQISKVLPQLAQNKSRYLSQDQVNQLLPQISQTSSNRFLSQDQILKVLPQLSRG
ncbi:glycoside hydrolase family 104 protein [Acinetobacter sp. Ac_5812]|uniref:glycoside hydrolase family 24 protein n=1 Tax=Acinetobacter sp. Ac_5812 TaxID=1848937 RepID=UPI001C0A1DD6|nr:glycoside hydrolase family 104 protein [Acinetobacter sp. Ac_5812]NNP70923.1 hypothetical protein [Acinetobacter sp. Ac_5812]